MLSGTAELIQRVITVYLRCCYCLERLHRETREQGDKTAPLLSFPRIPADTAITVISGESRQSPSYFRTFLRWRQRIMTYISSGFISKLLIKERVAVAG